MYPYGSVATHLNRSGLVPNACGKHTFVCLTVFTLNPPNLVFMEFISKWAYFVSFDLCMVMSLYGM